VLLGLKEPFREPMKLGPPTVLFGLASLMAKPSDTEQPVSRQVALGDRSLESGVRKTRRKSIRLTEGDSPRRPWAGTRYGLVVRHPISQAIPQSQWGCACLQGPLSPPKR
jgi:hypothetical protein